MQAISKIQSCTVVMPSANIDTDQIIPARFLTTTTRDGLGRMLFNDWRYLADGSDNPQFILNRPEAKGCRILVAGRNFGCGSSREHAPWTLLDYGFQAVISTGIADIFRSNSLKNGLVPVVVDESTGRWLLEHPGSEVAIDLESTTVTLPDGKRVSFQLDAFARYCLLNGVDELGYLLRNSQQIDSFERRVA